MAHPVQCAKQVILTARRWGQARGRYRVLLDSKSSEEKAIEKAKKRLLEETNRLETAVVELEKALKQYPASGKKIPWQKIFTGMRMISGALEAIGPGQGQQREPRTIDVQAEVKDA